MLNKVMIIGRLGADPEVKYAQSGMAFCNLRVATDESYMDRDGNKVDRTEWHRVVVFQRQAENCGKYLHKGSLVYVEGSLQTRKWQDPQGADRYSTDIRAQRVQFLDSKNVTNESGNDAGNYANYTPNYAPRQQKADAPNDGYPKYPQKQSGSDGDSGNSYMPRQQPKQPQAVNERSRYQKNPQNQPEDMGPAFPSEANGFPNDANDMDNVPF